MDSFEQEMKTDSDAGEYSFIVSKSIPESSDIGDNNTAQSPENLDDPSDKAWPDILVMGINNIHIISVSSSDAAPNHTLSSTMLVVPPTTSCVNGTNNEVASIISMNNSERATGINIGSTVPSNVVMGVNNAGVPDQTHSSSYC